MSGRYQKQEEFIPFWCGHAIDTVSTTDWEAIAIGAAHLSTNGIGSRVDTASLPQWLVNLRGDAPVREFFRGFVYQIRPLGSIGVIVPAQPHEISYLAISRTRITRFWVVDKDQKTAGPFPFPIPDALPGDWRWARSRAPRRLALPLPPLPAAAPPAAAVMAAAPPPLPPLPQTPR
jgi:hypothetical protein